MGKKNSTSFKKGESKGRPKGTQNKIVADARTIFKATLENQVPNIQEAFEAVRQADPARYLDLFAKYAQYFVPKQTDITTDGKQIQSLNIGFGKTED